MKAFLYLKLTALRALRVIRPFFAAAVIYFLFLTVWQAAYLHKVQHWPAIEARLIQRRSTFARRSVPNSRYQGGNFGLTFVEEVFYIPETRVWVTARDFGSLSPRRAAQELQKRNIQHPLGSIMRVRMNPRYPTEVTTLGEERQAATEGALGYFLCALGCLCAYGLLRTVH